jgi:hypothetical protein
MIKRRKKFGGKVHQHKMSEKKEKVLIEEKLKSILRKKKLQNK